MVTICTLASGENPTAMPPGQWKNLAKTLHAYSERNEETKKTDDQIIREWKSYAQLADYCMVRCKDLKDADSDWSFKKQPWITVVERMDAETQAVEQWHAKKQRRSTSIP